jgi:hypothetical protein
MKKKPAKQKPRTHFAQVPVTSLKRIPNVIVEPASRKTEPYSMPIASVRMDL